MADITEHLKTVLAGNDLSVNEMCEVMEQIMKGEATHAQMGGFLMALRMKGECIDEVTGAAKIMRRHAAFIDAGSQTVVDTCGTGGSGVNTFNISTTSSLVVAGAGITVAKHGNRSASSKCGSADVLSALGFNLDVDPIVMEQSIQENGIGFLFAPKVHPAMRNVMSVRKELKTRTIFNMLGPLTNPAAASGQVLGVFSPVLTEMFASVLKALGCRRAMVVHGNDGLDEITCTTSSRITELRDGNIKTYELYPEMLIGDTFRPEEIEGGDAEKNAAITKAVLDGSERGAPRSVVLLNAAAAIVTGEKAETMEEGIKIAEESIDSGAALNKLEILVEASNQ